MKLAARTLCLAGFAISLNAGEALTIGYSQWPGYDAWDIAIQLGWLKDAGLDIEFQRNEYGASQDAFKAGLLDAVMVTNGDQLVMGAAGVASKAMLILDYSFGNDMIIGREGIATVSALKGRKVGVEIGLVDHLLLLKALEVYGMEASDLQIVNVINADTPKALAAGTVDAIGAFQPCSGLALKQAKGSTVLFSSRDVPGLIYDVLAVSPRSLEQHRDAWMKLVPIWSRVVEFIDDPRTQPEALKIMSASSGTTVEEYAKLLPGTKLFDLAWNRIHFAIDDSLESIYGSNLVVHRFNLDAKVYVSELDPTTFLDPSLLPAP